MSDEGKQPDVTVEEAERSIADRMENDPNYRARVEAKERERKERQLFHLKAMEPIVRDLSREGVVVQDVWELVNTSDPYPAALPVLMNHLERGGYPRKVMEGLARALAVKPSRVFWGRLRDAYYASEDEYVREAVAVAMAASATRDHVDELIAFVKDESAGPNRLMVFRALKRLGGADAIALLKSLADHPDLGAEARALTKSRKT